MNNKLLCFSIILSLLLIFAFALGGCDTGSFDGGSTGDQWSGGCDTGSYPGGSTGDQWPNDGGSTNKSFIVTSVRDNLNNNDMRIFANGLSSLGYSKVLEDTNVSSSNLINYLGRDITTLYHTGHGDRGQVVTSNNNRLFYYSGVTLRAQNTIFATCLTLSTTEWKNTFSSTAQTLMGYTKVSMDIVDETVAQNMINQLRNGRSYKLAWYLSNSGIFGLSDRWAEYVREGGSIVEYSARSGSMPKYDASQLVSLDAKGIVRAILNLARSSRKYRSSFGMQASIDPSEVTTTSETGDLDLTSPVTITEHEAIVMAEDWLADNGGLPEDAVVDRVIPIHRQADDDDQKTVVGYTVHFRRNLNGTDVSGNRIEDHINILVNQNSVVAASRYWPELKKLKPAADEVQDNLLSVGEAIQRAAEEIANTVKQGEPVSIIEAEPVYGTLGPRRIERTLVPAYRYKSAEGHTFVINALTGELLL